MHGTARHQWEKEDKETHEKTFYAACHLAGWRSI
jgi:hypothetical protein